VDRSGYRKVLKWAATAVSAVWIGITVYSEFLNVDPDQYSFKSPDVEQRMRACGGTFQERYRCKEDAMIDKGQEGFIAWLEKIGLMFGPPFALFALVRTVSRPRTSDEPEAFMVPPPSNIARYRVR